MTDCSNNNDDDGDGNGNDNGDNENSAATAAVYWKQLQESTKLLTELLVYTNASSSVEKYIRRWPMTSLIWTVLKKFYYNFKKDHVAQYGSACRLHSMYSTLRNIDGI